MDTKLKDLVINEITEEKLKELEEANTIPPNELFVTEDEDEVLATISNPNLLINGDFRVNQRGTRTAETGKFIVDRWRARHNNTSDKIVTLNDDGSIKLSTLEVGWIYLDYTLDTNDTKALLGKTITLSMKIKNYTSINNLNSQIAIEKIVNGTLSVEVYKSFNSNGTITCTTIVNEADYIRVRTSANVNTSYDVEWAKLEIGSVATSFSPRPYDEELALCQKYFQNVWTTGCIFFARDTSTIRCMYKTEMRASPKIKAVNKIQLFSPTNSVNVIQDTANIGINAGLTNSHAVFITAAGFTGLKSGEIFQALTNEVIATLDAEMDV